MSSSLWRRGLIIILYLNSRWLSHWVLLLRYSWLAMRWELWLYFPKVFIDFISKEIICLFTVSNFLIYASSWLISKCVMVVVICILILNCRISASIRFRSCLWESNTYTRTIGIIFFRTLNCWRYHSLVAWCSWLWLIWFIT